MFVCMQMRAAKAYSLDPLQCSAVIGRCWWSDARVCVCVCVCACVCVCVRVRVRVRVHFPLGSLGGAFAQSTRRRAATPVPRASRPSLMMFQPASACMTRQNLEHQEEHFF